MKGYKDCNGFLQSSFFWESNLYERKYGFNSFIFVEELWYNELQQMLVFIDYVWIDIFQ